MQWTISPHPAPEGRQIKAHGASRGKMPDPTNQAPEGRQTPTITHTAAASNATPGQSVRV
jgi:hypothetical protein